MKLRNEKEIMHLFDQAEDEQDKLNEYMWNRPGKTIKDSGEEYIQKTEAQEKAVAEAYLKAWDLVFDTFKKEGVHKASQLEEDFADELGNILQDSQMDIWNTKDWDRVIAFNEKVASFDWEDDKYGESWTNEGSAKQEIADAYARKGDIQKAEQLYESYLKEDYARGEYWFAYINFLMGDNREKLPEKIEELKKGIKEKKIRMGDNWLKDLIYNLNVEKFSQYASELQRIIDEREKARKKKEAEKKQEPVKQISKVSAEQYGKYLPKKKQKELKKKGLLK